MGDRTESGLFANCAVKDRTEGGIIERPASFIHKVGCVVSTRMWHSRSGGILSMQGRAIDGADAARTGGREGHLSYVWVNPR
jgi:hypothetical protein